MPTALEIETAGFGVRLAKPPLAMLTSHWNTGLSASCSNPIPC